MKKSKGNTPPAGQQFAIAGAADLSNLSPAIISAMDRGVLEALALQLLEMNQKLQAENIALQQKLDVSEIMASIDALSGLQNKEYFEQAGGAIFEEAEKKGKNFTVVMIDINGLKKINDGEQDHSPGDALIAATSAKIANMFDHQVIIARTGGDEFGIIVPNGDVNDIEERLNALEGRIIIDLPNERYMNGVFSFGVANYEGQRSFEIIKKEADGIMYQQKEAKKAFKLDTEIFDGPRKITDLPSDYIGLAAKPFSSQPA